MKIRHVHRACVTEYDSHARKAASKPLSSTHCDTFHAHTRTYAEQHTSLTTARAPCKHDVFNVNVVTSDLVYTYKIVNGLFPHEFSAQVPNVCDHNGVMNARVVDGPPRTTS